MTLFYTFFIFQMTIFVSLMKRCGSNDNFRKPNEKVRVSFEGWSYSFSRARNAGLIRIRVLFEGESLSRIYGTLYFS